MPPNNFGSPKLETIIKEGDRKKSLLGITCFSKDKFNWFLLAVFFLSILFIVATSVFPVFSVKNKLADSSFDDSLSRKILDDIYNSEDYSGAHLPFVNPRDHGEIDDLSIYIEEEANKLYGGYGVYIKNIKTGEEFGINEEKPFTAASLSKLFAVGAYYSESLKSPTLMIDDLVLLQGDKVGGNGSLYNESIGNYYSPNELIEKSLKQSDNTAFAMLVRNIGTNKINSFIKDIGLENTNFYNNTTSPKDMGVFLESLYEGSFLTPDYKEEMLAFMQNTYFEDRIPFYLPQNIKISHKIGTWDGAYSDAGIIFGNRSDYIVVVMTDNADYDQSISFIRKISELFYNYFEQN